MKNIVAAILLLLLVSACSSFSLPVHVDLREHMGTSTSGDFQREIVAGIEQLVDVRHPGEDGDVVDFSEVDLPLEVYVQKAELTFDVSVWYDGPSIAGDLAVQLFLGPEGSESLWRPEYEVGPEQLVRLGRGEMTISGTVALNADQVQAINDRTIRWGVRIEGDVAIGEDGTATLEYEVKTLDLDAFFTIFE